VTLTAKDVAEITKLLEESDFDELRLELDGLKLDLRRSGAAAVAVSEERSRPALDPAPPAAAPPTPEVSAAVDDPQQQRVTSPLLGTFYRAPKPGAPPFIEIGSPVEPETVIGIIEVMKLMNTVRAGVHGQVTQVLARDGVLVEYGETLLLVSRGA
jgi:acetyl-CoA carboxylase biotin carboxyl carrier protein